MEWFNELKELAEFLLPWLSGGGAVYLINWLKGQLSVPDAPWLFGWNARAWLALGVSLGVALLALFVDGYFDPNNLSVANFAELLIAVVVTTQAYYHKFVKNKEPG